MRNKSCYSKYVLIRGELIKVEQITKESSSASSSSSVIVAVIIVIIIIIVIFSSFVIVIFFIVIIPSITMVFLIMLFLKPALNIGYFVYLSSIKPYSFTCWAIVNI